MRGNGRPATPAARSMSGPRLRVAGPSPWPRPGLSRTAGGPCSGGPRALPPAAERPAGLAIPDVALPEQLNDMDQLGVDRGAVEALVVVLDDDLPVRRDVVGDALRQPEVAEVIAVEVRDRPVAVEQCGGERLRVVAQV